MARVISPSYYEVAVSEAALFSLSYEGHTGKDKLV